MRPKIAPAGVGPLNGKRRIGGRGLGQALPEFALVLPVFMLLLLGAVDFGRVFFSYIAVRNAAAQGAAYGAVNPTDSSGITSKVQQETNTQGQSGENTLSVATACNDTSGVSITCASAAGGAGAGNQITVTVSERFNFLTPFINNFFGNNFSLGASATAAVLSLAPGAGATQPPGCTTPSASFTYTANGAYGLNVDASGSTPNSGQWAISSYAWDMGDNANPFPPVTGKTASYTYATSGTQAAYTVTLTVQNQCGQASTSQTVLIGPAPSSAPSAAPSAAPSSAPSAAPSVPACGMTANFNWTSSSKTVNFFGAAGGAPAPASWNWDFGDSSTGSGQNVAHTYASNSSQTVTLTVVNGTCTATKSYSVKPGNNGP